MRLDLPIAIVLLRRSKAYDMQKIQHEDRPMPKVCGPVNLLQVPGDGLVDHRPDIPERLIE